MSVVESSCTVYELRCNECGKSYGNRPQSACDDCLAPLEVHYDLESVRGRFTRESIASHKPSVMKVRLLRPPRAAFTTFTFSGSK